MCLARRRVLSVSAQSTSLHVTSSFAVSFLYISRYILRPGAEPRLRFDQAKSFKMGRGGSFYLSYSALVLLSAVPSLSALDADIFHVDIWNDPAPSPEDGPPFSANASRDRSLLPYQIIGIVGAYIGSVLIIGTLLLTVGRRSRKRAQTMSTARQQEMIKPMIRQYDPSPVSPASNRSWYKLRGKKSATSSIRSGASNARSPGMDSVVSFDTNVIEADRARRQQEMERLYAAVMIQDDRKAQASNAELPAAAPPEYSNGRPPRLITDAPGLRHLQGQPSPATPKSPIRAIYPPTASMPAGPMSPTSPIKADYPNYSYQQPQRVHGGDIESGMAPKKLRKSLRNIKISAPMVKDDNSDGARTPLSPRSYTDPGIPPEPPTAGTAVTTESDYYSPETPHTGRSWHRGEEEDMDEIRDLPQAAPQRASAHVYNNQAQALTNAASTRPDPTKPANATGTGALPFREMNRQYAAQSAQQAAAFPLSPGYWNSATSPSARSPGYLHSAGPVRTQFVDARRDRLGPGPRTGQATPYSPYMPYTPVTPVTPHLTSRAERKQRQREERVEMGVVTEEEAVKDEGELWSSGY